MNLTTVFSSCVSQNFDWRLIQPRHAPLPMVHFGEQKALSVGVIPIKTLTKEEFSTLKQRVNKAFKILGIRKPIFNTKQKYLYFAPVFIQNYNNLEFQRLEFLGDGIIDIAISKFLIKKHSDKEEFHGELRNKLRAGEYLHDFFVNQIGVDFEKICGKSIEKQSEYVEAFIAALSKHKGNDFAVKFYTKLLKAHIPNDEIERLMVPYQGLYGIDYKTLLNNHSGIDNNALCYKTINNKAGKTTVELTYKDRSVQAKADTKDGAQQKAARLMLFQLKIIDEEGNVINKAE